MLSGMRASAVHRCTLQCFSPEWALPTCRSRRSTVSSRNAVESERSDSRVLDIEVSLGHEHIKPGDKRQECGGREDSVAAPVDVADLEAVPSVPGQMPNP